MTADDPRRFLYRDGGIDLDGAKALAARHLSSCDDGETRTTTFGRSSTEVPPADFTVTAGASAFLPAPFASAVSAAAVRPTLLRLPKSHSVMYAKKAKV
jgi:hypothetical protein